MDVVAEDEKKSSDAETAQDEDPQPDPEEHLMFDQGNGRIWLIKVRKKHCNRPPRAVAHKWRLIRFQSSSWSDGHLSMPKMSI